MSFLVSLLLPVIATLILLPRLRGAGRARQDARRAHDRDGLPMGALSGAAALVFLSVLGVGILAYRGRTLTPAASASRGVSG